MSPVNGTHTCTMKCFLIFTEISPVNETPSLDCNFDDSFCGYQYDASHIDWLVIAQQISEFDGYDYDVLEDETRQASDSE